MTNKTWIGGASGSFNTSGDWSPGGEPGAGDFVFISGATVDFTATAGNSIETIQQLQLASGALLTINSGDFEIAAPFDTLFAIGISGVLQVNAGVLMIGAGALSLPGQIDLLGSDAMMQTAGATLTLEDLNQTGGVMLAGGSFGGRIAGGGGTGTLDTLINNSSLLHGSGFIGANAGFLDQLHIVNEAGGSIVADVVGLDLIVDDHIDNNGGVLMATAGGSLFVDGFIDQTKVSGLSSGTIEADDNSTVVIDKASVVNGHLFATATGTLRIGNDVTLDGVAIGAAVTLDSGTTLELTGVIINDGTGAIDATAGTLVLSGATISGAILNGIAISAIAANYTLDGNANVFEGTDTLDIPLTIGSAQTVTFGDGQLTDQMVNHSTIALKGPGATLSINSGPSALQLSGGGTVTLPDVNDRIAGASASALFDNVDNTIIGIGSIDNLATLTVDAGASIVASGGTLVLDATTIDNAGFLGAVPGSVLDIVGQLNNTGNLGGLIEFGGPGSGFANGTLPAGGTILVSAPGATFDSIENDGKIIVEPNAVLTLTGNTDNTGEIDLNGSGPGHHANLAISGMLSGGGKIVMDTGDTVNSIGSTPFVNEDNVIEGSGNLGTAGFSFVNHGLVNGNVAASPLLVDPTSPVVQNLSVMEASGGGTLGVIGDLVDTDIIGGQLVDSGVGTLLADGAGSVVALLGGSVTEGLLDSTNGGSVQVQAAETLLMGGQIIVLPGEQPPYARDSAFTNFADLQVLAGQTLTLASDGDQAKAFLHNFASVSLLGASGNGATLAIDATTIEIDGGGTLSLNNPADRIVGDNASDILINDATIAGFGLLGDGKLNLINDGWVVADDATRPLIVDTLGTFANNNTLAIGTTDGGGMVLEGYVASIGELANFGGTGAFILGGADGAVTLHGGVIEENTRVVSSATNSTIDASGDNVDENVENFGTIAIAADQHLTMLGSISNSGLFSGGSVHLAGDIELQASIDAGTQLHHGATLVVGGPTLYLQGYAGQVQLDDASDLINGAAGTNLISDANTITGAGQIGTGQLNFDNFSSESVVDATGTLLIDGPTITNNGTFQVSPGGELDIDGAVAGSGVMTVNSGVLTLNGAVAAGQTVEFAVGFINSETLALADPLAMAGSIQSLFGGVGKFDTIDLPHTAATSVNSDGHTLTVMNGVQIAAKLLLESSFHYNLIPDNSGGNFVVVACFAAGTGILTVRGEVPVESLRLGDTVVTLHGHRLAPVTWLGHRAIDCRRHPNPQAVWPVRVLAGAFGPAMPHADLLLSPDHAVLVDGWLIPIRHLVNGRTIMQEPRDQVVYWHVELPRHDVLLAEGLPAESYLDTGNREAFSETALVTRLHPGLAARLWKAESCVGSLRLDLHADIAVRH